jgi:hypothetical protein
MKIATVLSLALLAVAPAAAEVLETVCSPQQVLVTDKRIEISCQKATDLGRQSREGQREVWRFAYPLVSQSLELQLGSQVHLVNYYLSQMQTALTSSRDLRVWFESDGGRPDLFGCGRDDCRAIVALAIERTSQP